MLVLAAAACNWINPRSDFERDPFVMSHLTKGSGDAAVAADDKPLKPSRWKMFTASRSGASKPVQTASLGHAVAAETSPKAHAPDYAWILGRLRQRRGADSGWYVEYANAAESDPYGGELSLEDSPKLGLVREGDRVLLEGDLLKTPIGEPKYRVRKLALLD